jgi:predicted nucleic acid-binding protein
VLAETLRVELPDATDTMFVEVASAAGADCVVTGNRKHFPNERPGGFARAAPERVR